MAASSTCLKTVVSAANFLMMATNKIDNCFAYIPNYPIRKCIDRVPEKELECLPMDEQWRASIASRPWATHYTGNEPLDEELQRLRARLLAFGGHQVCLAYPEPDLEKIMARGQLWYGDIAIKKAGKASRCHSNSALYWLKNSKEQMLAIATGYALSEDGMWRQHSWCVKRGKRSLHVIETTCKRIAYYGFVLTDSEAVEFCDTVIC